MRTRGTNNGYYTGLTDTGSCIGCTVTGSCT